MDEQSEIPQKEQTVIAPELGATIKDATTAIETEMRDPAAQIAQPTEQLSMFAELGRLGKETTLHRLSILFKDAKVALGIVPFINKVSEWNTARIAAQPVNAAEALVGKSPQLAAQAEIAAKEATTVSAVEKAAKAEVPLAQDMKAEVKAQTEYASSIEKYNKAVKRGTGVDKAREQMQAKETAYFTAAEKQAATREQYTPYRNKALDALNNRPDPTKKEGWASRTVRKAANIHTDTEFKEKYLKNKSEYAKHNVPVTEAELIRITANGEAPVFTKGDKFKRGAKLVGIHLLWENLGPIINPIPDVPPLVSTASYVLEGFGGQWWAGLVPPVWQYLHNRVEDFTMSYETSKKAIEIVKRHWNQRVDHLEEKKVEKAAGVFLPQKAMTPAV